MNWVKQTFKKLPVKPKGWVSINDIVTQTGNNRRTVAFRVSGMVTAGELMVMDATENGRRVKVYKKKQ